MNILKNGGDTRGMIESQNKCLNKLKIRTKLVIIRVQNRNIFQITEVSLHKFFFACLLSTNLLRSFCSQIIKSSKHQLINPTMNSNSDTNIFKELDFGKKISYDKYFPIVVGKGHYKPPWRFFAVSGTDPGRCFDKIREWRNLNGAQQIELNKKLQNLSKEECKAIKFNYSELQRLQKAEKLVASSSNEENFLNENESGNGRLGILGIDDDSDDESVDLVGWGGGIGINVDEEMISNVPPPRIVTPTESSISSETDRNEHVGLLSHHEARKRAFEMIEDDEKKQRDEKKRKVGEPPNLIKQQSDRISLKARKQCMLASARYVDTATFRSDDKNLPKCTVVTLIYSEVNRNSSDGSTVSKTELRMEKPELICMISSGTDCSKAMKGFNDCFVRGGAAREKYDHHLLKPGEDGKLSTVVEDFLTKQDKCRRNGRMSNISVEEILQRDSVKPVDERAFVIYN